jgi:hypothetical protein
MIKAQAIPNPTPTASDLGKQTDQHVSRASSKCKAAGSEVTVVEAQAH